jgi:hypothetical protein
VDAERRAERCRGMQSGGAHRRSFHAQG